MEANDPAYWRWLTATARINPLLQPIPFLTIAPTSTIRSGASVVID